MNNIQNISLKLLFCLLVSSCSFDQKENWINEIIDTGLSERDEVMSDGTIVDTDIYRDGGNDGVCYEYVLSEGETMDSDELKSNLVSAVRTITLDDRRFKTAIESGIYIRFIYKTRDGRVLGDQIITSSDL
jgi:hypothetical protein